MPDETLEVYRDLAATLLPVSTLGLRNATSAEDDLIDAILARLVVSDPALLNREPALQEDYF